MASPSLIQGDLYVAGNISAGGQINGIERTDIASEGSALYALPIESWRVFDAYGTVLPGTSAADDLGIYGQTHGTGCPYIGTGDVKTTSITRKARITFQIPPNYADGESIFIRAHGGMITTAADGSATVDFAVYKRNSTDSLITGSDLVTTSATSINSTTWASKDFVITASGLVRGDWLDILATVAVVDTASGTAVIAGFVPSIALTIQG